MPTAYVEVYEEEFERLEQALRRLRPSYASPQQVLPDVRLPGLRTAPDARDLRGARPEERRSAVPGRVALECDLHGAGQCMEGSIAGQ